MQSQAPRPDSNQQTAPQILVFDSGAGAFSVFKEIQRLEPQFQCTLALDNAHFPYGTLSESELIQRVLTVISKLIKLTQPDLVVVACNTASTLVLDELRKHFDLPFVGVVPAIKPAALMSSSQSIGLLATPATVQRSYTENLIEDFAPDCEILKVGSTELVYMAEQKLRGDAIDLDQLQSIVAPFSQHPELDTLVLACTHFPLLQEELSRVLPTRIKLLDSGTAIAQRVSSLIRSAETGNKTQHKKAQHKKAQQDADDQTRPHQLYMTGEDVSMEAIVQYSRTLGFRHTQVMPV